MYIFHFSCPESPKYYSNTNSNNTNRDSSRKKAKQSVSNTHYGDSSPKFKQSAANQRQCTSCTDDSLDRPAPDAIWRKLASPQPRSCQRPTKPGMPSK